MNVIKKPVTPTAADSPNSITTVGMMLLPPRPDVCQECAVKHEPELPHNAQSLFYQVKFEKEHRRGPTWEDAMAHCDDEMKRLWRQGLEERGVDVAAGEINPKKRRRRN